MRLFDYFDRTGMLSWRIKFVLELLAGFFKSKTASCSKDRTLIIGQYGGEHVGDSAILGGVLNSLRSDKFDVLSIRPFRTQMWIDGLNLNIDVKAKGLSEVLKNIKGYSKVIYAGGPLMDLPSILLMHFVVVGLRNDRAKFEIVGVGVLDFKRRFSKFLATKLLNAASDVSVRSDRSLSLANAMNVCARRVTDPAIVFIRDNIQKRPQVLRTRRRLLINLRPLWANYTSSFSLKDLAEKEERIVQDLCWIVSQLIERYGFAVDFVPFNCDQFGMSDISVGLKMQQILADNPSFNLIYEEFLFHEMLGKVAVYDFAICMRLHAAVFCNESGVKTFGLDYSDGFGKVSQYFDEGGISDRCWNLITFDKNKVLAGLVCDL
jgi:polysaccharide pyruvyl transferase WcaK-like protein